MLTKQELEKLAILKDIAICKQHYYLAKSLKTLSPDYQADYKYFTEVRTTLENIIKSHVES